jgi:hypothetical protein
LLKTIKPVMVLDETDIAAAQLQIHAMTVIQPKLVLSLGHARKSRDSVLTDLV